MTFYDGEVKDLIKRNPGWKTDLAMDRDVRCLPMKDQPHKIFWDHDKTRLHMYTTGFFSSHVDNKMGISFDDLEGLSIRQQRDIIKQRAHEMHRMNSLKYKFSHTKYSSIQPAQKNDESVIMNDTLNYDKKMIATGGAIIGSKTPAPMDTYQLQKFKQSNETLAETVVSKTGFNQFQLETPLNIKEGLVAHPRITEESIMTPNSALVTGK